ncbi:MAG: hypothetical protein FOGNACKC_06401 [Anaerolineae bacterium]|nr:hypothetical protein [Anaerolineae bacterium]
MDNNQQYLPGQFQRAKWLRLDSAKILKRFFFCERELIKSQAGWLAGIADFEAKLALPYHFWQDALTAHALRERVFELKFPSRMLEIGDDQPLIDVFAEAANAPGAAAFLLSLARVYKPALLTVYRDYVSQADPLADGPILRALRLAVDEKAEQIAVLTRFANTILNAAPEKRHQAEAWVAALGERLGQVGGLSLDPPQAVAAPVDLPGRTEFALAQIPARDSRFHLCRYYWPDIIDPTFPYGDGIQLQLRSAVSHFNEVWAVESGGAVLHAFADGLEWEFMYDAARWTYDEARHARMGYDRLHVWGFEPHEIPLGTHIYDSAFGQDPVVRLGMLHYFETKNIGKKTKRANAFGSYQDRMSQHDMDFDWADETIHAYYGKHWLDTLHAAQPERVPDIEALRETCETLVVAQVADATDSDRAETRQIAQAMLDKAQRRQLRIGNEL